MNEAILKSPRRLDLASVLFPLAILTSAALVFFVQPMVAKMLLPKLGGSPAVWNTSMVFFQAALLLGYAYAHLVQRLADLRIQVLVHFALLGLAALVLPVVISAGIGDPDPEAPVVWLLAALTLCVGAPFAVLSATAPLLQSWFAKLQGAEVTKSPYALYVASNLGSLAALLAYPTLVEPFLELQAQAAVWALGYGVFALLVVALGLLIFKTGRCAAKFEAQAPVGEAPSRTLKALWIALAAAPASLLLGVTTFITTDVAAAPFLWVAPLALYLVTFIIAFQTRPLIGRKVVFVGQIVFTPLALVSMTVLLNWYLVLFVHAAAFFFSALVCHQALAARKPEPSRLTQFYLFVSLGGVIGGAATSFLAPVIFDKVLEYPLVLLLALLAGPWPKSRFRKPDTLLLLTGVAGAGLCLAFAKAGPALPFWIGGAMAAVVLAAVLLKPKPKPLFVALALVAIGVQAITLSQPNPEIYASRSFFGVHRVAYSTSRTLGPLTLLSHGTTVHGAQPRSAQNRCVPTTYYAPDGAIAHGFALMKTTRPKITSGVVGLGAGSVATYLRPGDRMRFFEIDPEVARIASDPRYFTYLSSCAKAPVDIVLGDARITLAREAPGSLDVLLLDAFTSDAIPTHLLTVEAIGQYLKVLKPDGVLLVHTSNRHLALEGVVTAAAKEAGAQAYIQQFRPPGGGGDSYVANASDVIAISRSTETLAPFVASRRWFRAHADDARPWTDDYTNVVGALIEQSRRR